ncbi:MAG TPA: prepilin-type N-terminal cleavage/methylation domain-containing protein [Thermaerobacter sp.]
MQRGRDNRRRRQGGFTLVELGVVLAILAILVAIAVPTYITLVNRAREAEAQQVWSMVKTELWSYYVEHDEFPTPSNNWWPGIDPPPQGTQWSFSAAGDADSATLVATRDDGAVKRCWTIDKTGQVTNDCQ